MVAGWGIDVDKFFNAIGIIGSIVTIVAAIAQFVLWKASENSLKKLKEESDKAAAQVQTGVDRVHAAVDKVEGHAQDVVRVLVGIVDRLVPKGAPPAPEAPGKKAEPAPAAAAAMTDREYLEMLSQVVKFGRIVRRVDLLEKAKEFVGLKWLNETVLRDSPEEQALLTEARQDGLIAIYERDNPKTPEYKVKCCRLNRTHPLVMLILDDKTKRT